MYEVWRFMYQKGGIELKTTQLNWPVLRSIMERGGYANAYSLAAAAGLHKNTLYRYGEVSLSTVDRLARTLNCSSLDLLIYTDTPVERTRRSGAKGKGGSG
jgi:DNA-binding Xre family transcriptional regulator